LPSGAICAETFLKAMHEFYSVLKLIVVAV